MNLGVKPLKIVSLNIELRRNLARVLPFLAEERPDIVCLQEIFEDDLPLFQNALGMKGRFEPMARTASQFLKEEERGKVFGIALFSRLPAEFAAAYYSGAPNTVPLLREGGEPSGVLLSASLEAGGERFVVGTTHFTWTPDGRANEAQRRNVEALLQTLAKFPEIVFCGDFNAPRGGEIWNNLAARYKDNIPLRYDTSLDPVFHRAAPLKRLVDGIFSTPAYRVFDVRMKEGVSDHCAVVGFVLRSA